MLFDARGNLMGEAKKEYRCNLLGEDFKYWVVPKAVLDKMERPYECFRFGYKHAPFANVMIMTDYDILVSEEIPKKLRDVFAIHGRGHSKNLTHSEIFPLELAAAGEAGVSEDYVKFMNREDVFRTVRKYNRPYVFEDGNGLEELRKHYGAKEWKRIENAKTENERLVDL